MKVLIVEPNNVPYAKKIESSLSSLQTIVGGNIEAIYPFDERVAVICNEEGKFMGLPLNRALRDEDGNISDIIAGTFFLCAAPSDSESFESLTDLQAEKYAHIFRSPEKFISINGRIIAITIEAGEDL